MRTKDQNLLLTYQKQNGFTLIELLVVIAIIGILASVVLTSLNTARYKAQVASVQLQLSNIEKSINLMASDTDNWPNHQSVDCTNTSENNEVADLSTPSAGLTTNDTNPDEYPGWNGPYISSLPTDPWGGNYFFDTDYYVTDSGSPCGQNGSTSGCTVAVAIGSLGKENDGGINDYDSDNIIKILSKNTVCQ